MADKEIHRIEGPISSLGNGQIGVESTPDADLGFLMYGGKDWAGGVHKFLDKDRPGSLQTIRLIGPTTTGSEGLLRHATDGWVTGGPITLDDLNDLISDADLSEGHWSRDEVDNYLYPNVNTDTVVVGDGTEANPAYAFDGAIDTGWYTQYGYVSASIAGRTVASITPTGFYGWTDLTHDTFTISTGSNAAIYPELELACTTGPSALGPRIWIRSEGNYAGQQASIVQRARAEFASWSAEAFGDGGTGATTTLAAYSEGNTWLELHCTSTGTATATIYNYARGYTAAGGQAVYKIAAEDPSTGNTQLKMTSINGIFEFQSKGNYILNIQYEAGTEIRNLTEYFIFENEHLSGGANGTTWIKNFVDGMGNMYLENEAVTYAYSIIKAAATAGGANLIVTADGTTSAQSALKRTAADGTSAVIVDSDVSFYDVYMAGSTWGYSYGIPLAESIGEWNSIRTLLGGDGSIFAAILASSGAGGSLDAAYTIGRQIDIDYGAVRMVVGGSGTDVGLQVENLNSSNTSENIGIYNDAALSTGYVMYMQGDQGGDGTDYLEFGHLLWTPGSVTIGHGTGTGDEIRRSYTSYHYRNDAAVPWAAVEMRAEADTAYGQYASVVCRAGNYGAVSANIDLETSGYIGLDCTLAASIEAGGNITFDTDASVRFSDGQRSGSTWTSPYMNLSAGSEWSTMEQVIGSEGTLFAGIIAAASPLVAEDSSEGLSSTTSVFYVEKLSLTTPSLVSGIGYLILWNYELGADAENDVHARVHLNNTTVIGEGYYDNDPYATRYRHIAGHFYSDTLSGVNTIDIDYYRAYGAGSVYIQRARIQVLRVNMS